MSAHGLDLDTAPAETTGATAPAGSVAATLARILDGLNGAIMTAASLALVLASAILSYSVVARYVFHSATYWQDEASVFLLVGATFLTAASVQSRRGHVGIEALVAILPPAINAARRVVVDGVSMAFCAFFAWKSWTLFHEAWVDGQVTSSTWGPPLWIPYAVMATGMTLLSVQIAVQILLFFSRENRP